MATIISVKHMISKCMPLLGSAPITEWERMFLENVEREDGDGIELTSIRKEKLQIIYDKYFTAKEVL